jgi:hypothetical protein
MKITKAQLKQIIKEELENIQEDPVDLMTDAEKLRLLFDALALVAYNFSPVAMAALVAHFLKKVMGMNTPADVEIAAAAAIEQQSRDNS